MDTLSNGNVVLIRAEQRPGDTTIVSKFDQRIYVYCLDQDGNPVWSDATKMPVIPQQKKCFPAPYVTASSNRQRREYLCFECSCKGYRNSCLYK